MSCQLNLGLLEDVSRIITHTHNFMLRIQSYNHSILDSPPISLAHPTWDYHFSFLASQKQIIKFHLCSLNPDHFMKVLAVGKFDIRDYVSQSKPSQKFSYRLPLFSDYNNEAILHIRGQFLDETRSRNEGLKQTSFPKKVSNIPRTQSPRNILIKQKYQQDQEAFFKGPCDTRNFFSFLDEVFKGQTFNFLEPVKK